MPHPVDVDKWCCAMIQLWWITRWWNSALLPAILLEYCWWQGICFLSDLLLVCSN